MTNDETSWKNVKKQNSRALAKTFSQNLEGGGGVEFGKDILANLNYADSLRSLGIYVFVLRAWRTSKQNDRNTVIKP